MKGARQRQKPLERFVRQVPFETTCDDVSQLIAQNINREPVKPRQPDAPKDEGNALPIKIERMSGDAGRQKGNEPRNGQSERLNEHGRRVGQNQFEPVLMRQLPAHPNRFAKLLKHFTQRLGGFVFESLVDLVHLFSPGVVV